MAWSLLLYQDKKNNNCGGAVRGWTTLRTTQPRQSFRAQQQKIPVSSTDDNKHNSVAAEVQHFVDCIEEGKTPIIDGHQGRDSVELVHAIYQSAKSGEKIVMRDA